MTMQSVGAMDARLMRSAMFGVMIEKFMPRALISAAIICGR